MKCPSCDHDNIPGADQCENCDMDLAGLDVGAWGVDPDDVLLTRNLAELSLKAPLELPPEATALDAMRLMQQRREGCVFVKGGDGALLGVFTEHDVAARVVGPGRDPAQALLEEVMTPDPVHLEPGDPLAWSLHRMGVDGHRHLPIVDGDELVGFLSSRTVLRVLLEN